MAKYYEVLEYNDLEELVEEVEAFMKGGWVPLGGVSAYTDIKYQDTIPCVYYLQAMTLEEE
jgi:hypothetical protein